MLLTFIFGIEPYSEWRCGRGAGDSCAYLIALRIAENKPDESKRLEAAYQHVFVAGCSQGREMDCRRAANFAPGGITHGTGREAVALQRLLCSQAPGDAQACFVLGVLLLRGEGPGMDVDRPGAIANLERACSLGHTQGCTIVQELAALAPLEAKCDGGDLVACQPVETMFALGGRVPYSWKWASRYQARACDLGSAQMCYRAGFQLKNPERKPHEARAFFVRACDMKYLPGCEELALMETDIPRRLLLLRSACDSGSAKACAELGQRAATGNGVPLNAAAALADLDRGCDAGNGDVPTCEAFWPVALESRDSTRIGRALRGLHAGVMAGGIANAAEKLEGAKKELQQRCDRHETYACEALKQSSPL